MEKITEALLAWYDRNARTLPWRGIRNAYRTWVSEAMLQQTRVETVLGYYDRFLARFPTLLALASAPEEEVLKSWEGLGYYSRARNLLAGARQVMAEYDGVLPRDPEALEKIKGIGPYTARAIASIAYDVQVAAVDGNVIRVICRLDNLDFDPLRPENRRVIEARAEQLVPPERPGDHNQAMMDLGATLCVPGTPDCAVCPLRCFCQSLAHGDPASLPKIPKARPPREIRYDLPVIFSGGRVLIRKRTEKMLQGLWCFPLIEGEKTPEELNAVLRKKLRLETKTPRLAGEAKHVFTHQIWYMKLYIAEAAPDAEAPEGWLFASPAEIAALPFPAAMKAALALTAVS